MTKLLTLFNHTLTEDQIKDAEVTLGIDEIVNANDKISKLWSSVPAEDASIKNYLSPVFKWIEQEANKGDFVLIQGDFGATYILVNFAKSKGFIPIYSTTERVAREIHQDDGTVFLNKVFKHVIFRKYED